MKNGLNITRTSYHKSMTRIFSSQGQKYNPLKNIFWKAISSSRILFIAILGIFLYTNSLVLNNLVSCLREVFIY